MSPVPECSSPVAPPNMEEPQVFVPVRYQPSTLDNIFTNGESYVSLYTNNIHSNLSIRFLFIIVNSRMTYFKNYLVSCYIEFLIALQINLVFHVSLAVLFNSVYKIVHVEDKAVTPVLFDSSAHDTCSLIARQLNAYCFTCGHIILIVVQELCL